MVTRKRCHMPFISTIRLVAKACMHVTTEGVMVAQAANTIAAAHPDKPRPEVTALAKLRTDVAVVPTQTGNQLVRKRHDTLVIQSLASNGSSPMAR